MPVKKATLLKDGSKVEFSNKGGVTDIRLPKDMSADPIATVVKLDLKGKLPPEKLISNSEKVFRIVDAD